MIPHVIAHPDRPQLLQFVYDFDAKTTTIKRHTLDGGRIVAGIEKPVPHLLRYPVARGDSWYAAVMDEREFGEPAFVERWTWDDLEQRDAHLIEHPKFGLTALGVSPSCRLAVLDRFFATDDDEANGARVVTLPELRPIGAIPINAHMTGPVFDAAEERVAMVLYDQDRCSANVYRLGDDGAEQVADLASKQIVTDFESGCVAFLPGDRLVVWSVENWSFKGQVGVYDIAAGETQLVVPATSGNALEADDEEAFSFRLSNTELAMLVDDDRLLVGAIGAVVAVDLATGDTETRPIEGAGAVVQVRRCGPAAVAIDDQQQLWSIPGL